MPKSFGDRLQATMKAGGLTSADLALWFDRRYATVHAWVYSSREPSAPWRDEAERRLILLEKAVKRSKGPLIPYELGRPERSERLRDVYKRAS
jgi:hypothetical protein